MSTPVTAWPRAATDVVHAAVRHPRSAADPKQVRGGQHPLNLTTNRPSGVSQKGVAVTRYFIEEGQFALSRHP